MKDSSTALNAKRGRNEGKKDIEYPGASFSDLPSSILENIIVRLPIKRIFACKCVCKTWCGLISNPEFAKLHFDQAQIYPLIRSFDFSLLSRILYLVQLEPEDFELEVDTCDYLYDDNDDICFFRVKVKPDTKIKISLSDYDMNGSYHMLNSQSENHKYRVVNSCNGLLCLSNPSDNDPVLVWNPITGEFINLPGSNTTKPPELHIECGFGFSPVTNQYKVIRMVSHMIQDGIRFIYRIMAEVHILGTKSWKDIGSVPYSMQKLFPTNLNGYIHWFSESDLVSFDVEKEQFESVSMPPLRRHDDFNNVAMGVLGGEICLTDAYKDIHLWLMDSEHKCWYKLFSIFHDSDFEIWPRGSYQPIKYLNNGAILMFHSGSNAFLYIDKNKAAYKYLKVPGSEFKMEVISHISSFISLKDLLPGRDVEVLNVTSRCADLMVHNDAETVPLVAERVQIIPSISN